MSTSLLIHVLSGACVVMVCGWLVQRRAHILGIADLLWAAIIGAAALYYGTVAPGPLSTRILVMLMGGIWSLRLVLHLLKRMLLDREDARHRELRRRWKNDERRFLLLFLGRAVSATGFSVPLLIAAGNTSTPLEPWTLAAAATYLIGLSGEAYADLQLTAFRAQPRHLGHACRIGLWRYSRHPNYLFGCIQWCAYPLLAMGAPWPLWSLTLLGPVLTVAGWLVRIPAVEAQAIRTRGEDYLAYRKATSTVLPWFPQGWPDDAPDMSRWHTPLELKRATPAPQRAPRSRVSTPS